MNKKSRREMLAKLGAGAAALTTMAVAGVADAQRKTTATRARQLTQAKIVSRNIVPISPGDTNVQIEVGIDKKGMLITSKRLGTTQPVLGLTKDRKVLQLGLKIKNGAVEVVGLDQIVNGVGAASSGRCTMRVASETLVVRPGDSLVNKAKGLATF